MPITVTLSADELRRALDTHVHSLKRMETKHSVTYGPTHPLVIHIQGEIKAYTTARNNIEQEELPLRQPRK